MDFKGGYVLWVCVDKESIQNIWWFVHFTFVRTCFQLLSFQHSREKVSHLQRSKKILQTYAYAILLIEDIEHNLEAIKKF